MYYRKRGIFIENAGLFRQKYDFAVYEIKSGCAFKKRDNPKKIGIYGHFRYTKLVHDKVFGIEHDSNQL